MSLILTILIVGILVGFMSSTLGIGGGIIIVPVLNIYFGYHQQEAIATSLLTIVFVSFMNVLRFQLQKQIIWRTVLIIALFSSVSSFFAGIVAVHLSEIILLIAFILFIVFMAYKTFSLATKPQIKRSYTSMFLSSMKIGSISGFISGITGVGGGAITTPLILTGGLANNKQTVPISNGIMFFTTSFAALAFALMPVEDENLWQVGYLHVNTALLLFVSAFPSAYIGTKFQQYLSLKLRKNLLGVFLLVIGIRLMIKLVN